MFKLEQENNNAYQLIAFLLWPVIVLITSIKNYRTSWAKNGLLLFIVFFGFTFVPREGNDSMQYIEWFQEFHAARYDLSSFTDLLYNEETSYVDILQPLISFIVAQFTNDYRILFAVFGLIFGFFYTRNIWYVLEKTGGQLNTPLIVFIIIFSLVVPFWAINGVRFWTATQIFLYGALRFLLDSKNKGIWISALSVFMHFSFMFPVLILLVYRMVGNRTTVFFVFFIISSFITEINISFIREAIISFTPEVFHDRVESYTDNEKVAAQSTLFTDAVWYVVLHRKALTYSILFLLISVFINGKEVWALEKGMLRLFSFLLLFGGFANLISNLPSGGRFITVEFLFATAFLFLYFYFNHSEKISKRLFFYLTPALGLFIIVAIRSGFDNTGVLAFISNPLIAPFLTNKIALIDLIK